MAEKSRQTKRLEHIDRQDRPEGKVRAGKSEVGVQKSKPHKAQHDGRGIDGLVQDNITYPCVEVMPNAIVLYMFEGKGIYLQAEEALLLSELLSEASAECLFCELDS